MKTYLQSYEPEIYQALNSEGMTYILEVIEVRFFGLIKTRKKITYTIPDFHNSKGYFSHWDKLIETQKPIEHEQ